MFILSIVIIENDLMILNKMVKHYSTILAIYLLLSSFFLVVNLFFISFIFRSFFIHCIFNLHNFFFSLLFYFFNFQFSLTIYIFNYRQIYNYTTISNDLVKLIHFCHLKIIIILVAVLCSIYI